MAEGHANHVSEGHHWTEVTTRLVLRPSTDHKVDPYDTLFTPLLIPTLTSTVFLSFEP